MSDPICGRRHLCRSISEGSPSKDRSGAASPGRTETDDQDQEPDWKHPENTTGHFTLQVYQAGSGDGALGEREKRVNHHPVYTLTSNQRILCLPQTRGRAHHWLNRERKAGEPSSSLHPHLKPEDFMSASNQRSCTQLAQPA